MGHFRYLGDLPEEVAASHRRSAAAASSLTVRRDWQLCCRPRTGGGESLASGLPRVTQWGGT